MNTGNHTHSQPPKPQAPINVTILLQQLEHGVNDDSDEGADQDIDSQIGALENVHTQLTRDLHQARA